MQEQDNPFLKNGKLADNTSLNRVEIVDIPGVDVDPEVKGKIGLEIMSLGALVNYIKQEADWLRLDLDKIPENRLPIKLDNCLEAEDLEVRLTAENIARRLGRNFGYILAVLKRGDEINQAAREDWKQKHWDYWQQVEKITLAGGLCSGNLADRFKYYVERVFQETDTPQYELEIAEKPSLVSFLGAARRVAKQYNSALVFDFGHTSIKRGVVSFKEEKLKEAYQLPSVEAKYTQGSWEFETKKEEKRAAEKLKSYIISVIKETWREVKREGFKPGSTIAISIANDLVDGEFVGEGYGKLRYATDNFQELAKEKISDLIGDKIELFFVHDGTAASDTFAGRKDSVILTLGTAIGVGFPRESSTLRPVAKDINFEYLNKNKFGG